jgi:hypothetical protein
MFVSKIERPFTLFLQMFGFFTNFAYKGFPLWQPRQPDETSPILSLS